MQANRRGRPSSRTNSATRMIIAGFSRLGNVLFERLFKTLFDTARCDRTMLLLLAGYAATWTLRQRCQEQSGSPPGHGRTDRLVERSQLRLSQASPTCGMGGPAVV